MIIYKKLFRKLKTIPLTCLLNDKRIFTAVIVISTKLYDIFVQIFPKLLVRVAIVLSFLIFAKATPHFV